MNQVIQELLQRDCLSNLTSKEVYKLLNAFGFRNLNPHPELFYRLEPYIFKYLMELNSSQLLRIASIYLRSKQGTRDLVQSMLTIISQKLDHTTEMPKLMELVNELKVERIERYNFDINLHSVMHSISQFVLQNVNKLSQRHLMAFMHKLGAYGIGDTILYEILALEFVKNVNSFSLD